jgi:cyclic lactone autoinducer peptide
MKGRILAMVGCAAAVIGALVVNTASTWVLYQPRAPKSLSK